MVKINRKKETVLKTTQYRPIALLVLVALSSLAWSADLKFAHFNSEVIMKALSGTAQKEYDVQLAKWTEEAVALKNAISDSKAVLDTLPTDSERRLQVKRQLDSLRVAYQKFIEEKFGSTGESIRLNESLVQPAVHKINRVLDSIGRAEKYTYIFDIKQGSIAFANPSLSIDLTDLILSILGVQRAREEHVNSTAKPEIASRPRSNASEKSYAGIGITHDDPGQTQICRNAQVIDRKEFQRLTSSQNGMFSYMTLNNGYYMIGGRCYKVRD